MTSTSTGGLRREAVVALLVTAYSVVLGGGFGLVWPRVAPHVAIIRAIDGSEASTKALLGDDMWFALLGIVAGVLSLAILLLAAREGGRGPGAVLGLAAGGILGSLVAAHIGHRIQSPHLVTALRAGDPHVTDSQIRLVLGYFDFQVRAKAALLAWSVAAVVVLALSIVLRHLRFGPDR